MVIYLIFSRIILGEIPLAKIAIIGGTGDLGFGLALRLAKAGHEVIIGSRKLNKALEAAEKANEILGENLIKGLENADAARESEIIILAVPFQYAVETIRGLKESLTKGKIVVSPIVPLATVIGDKATRVMWPWQGSAAELVKFYVPSGVKVVAAFHNVSAGRLREVNSEIECDVLVCGDDQEAKEKIIKIANSIPGIRGLDAGPLSMARIIEGITALLISLNVKYGVRKGTGIRITYL